MLHMQEYITEPSSQTWQAADALNELSSEFYMMSNKTEPSPHKRPFIQTDRRIT